MALDSTIFRENDIRGLVETQLGDDAVYAIGRAYATLLVEAGGRACAVGMDVRTSGPRIKATFIRGVRDGGVHVTDIGAVTTPVSYFAAFTLPASWRFVSSRHSSRLTRSPARRSGRRSRVRRTDSMKR